MKLAVIDIDHLFFLCLTGEKILDISGQPIKEDNRFVYRERTLEESILIADNYITNILNITNCDSYIGFFGGSSQSRKLINPEYKANRVGLEPLKNLHEMKVYLQDKWKFVWLANIKFNQYETDDYVCSFVKQTPNSFIVSPDKDLLNLVGVHYNPKQNKEITITEEQEDIYFWKSMIIGDVADNIVGIYGKGEKFVDKLFNEFEVFNPPNIYRAPRHTKVFQAYLEYSTIDEFYKNYKCLKLREDLDVSSFVPIAWNNNIISDLEFDID